MSMDKVAPNKIADTVKHVPQVPSLGGDLGEVLHFAEAAERLQGIVNRTPLQLNANLSRKYQCNVYLKREDLQVVRSYKLRGAYNMMSSLPKEQLQKGVVCGQCR